MATKDDLRVIAGKALADPEFRQKLNENPEAAVQEMGIELSEEQIQALKMIDKEQLEAGMGELEERLTMSCWGHSQLPGTNQPYDIGPTGAEGANRVSNLPCVWD